MLGSYFETLINNIFETCVLKQNDEEIHDNDHDDQIVMNCLSNRDELFVKWN